MNAELTIRNLAIDIAPDYPEIKEVDFMEHVYAIRTTYEGTSLALADAHKVIDHLRIELDMSEQDVYDLWLSIMS